MLACRIEVEILLASRNSYVTITNLGLVCISHTSYGTRFESTRISILSERGFQFRNLGLSTKYFNTKHGDYQC
jgi:hypothetical protein